MRAVVIGGGIAGLAAVHRLVQLVSSEEPREWPVLVERRSSVGGKLLTERVDGFVVEAAADSFLSRKERGVGLCEELGLRHELIGRRPEHARTFVRKGRGLHPLPEGLTGTIPTNLDALSESSLLSPEAKARLAAEVDLPPDTKRSDESVAGFVSRRLGPEAWANLVEPLVTGIYGGDGTQLSLQATFPQLRTLELEHGSVLRGLASAPASAGSVPPFVTLRSGMDVLVRALCSRLEGRMRAVSGRSAVGLRRTGEGWVVGLDDRSTVDVDAVILAVPAFEAASLLAGVDPDLAELHSEITYASSAIVTLAYREEDVPPLDGYGYVVPRVEGTDVLACTWTSRKWSGRAPEGTVLIRVYAGRFGGRDVTEMRDGELLGLARGELALLGISAEPILTRFHRWSRGMPQYVLGHVERVERIEAALEAHPGLAVAGAAYRGVGIPDCIRSGEEAADSVARALGAVLR
jgi:protoporphyrinogen/coproporphyrinogen III oxidase